MNRDELDAVKYERLVAAIADELTLALPEATRYELEDRARAILDVIADVVDELDATP